MIVMLKKALLFALFPLFTTTIVYGAEAPTEVVEIVIIDTTGASEPFAPMFDRFSAAYEKHESQGERSLWASVFSGSNTGSQIVYIVYPTLEAFAADKTVLSEEYQALGQEFNQKGFRVSSRHLNFRNR
jgi:hypothetical protein